MSMENKNPGNTSGITPWKRCHSKSRPGCYYMFNTATGETKWCNSLATPKITKDTKSKIAKSKQTPAQDRLKRLQSKLKKDNEKKKINNSYPKTKPTAKKSEERKVSTATTTRPSLSPTDTSKILTNTPADLTNLDENSGSIQHNALNRSVPQKDPVINAKRVRRDTDELARSSSGILVGEGIGSNGFHKSSSGQNLNKQAQTSIKKFHAHSDGGETNSASTTLMVQATVTELQKKRSLAQKETLSCNENATTPSPVTPIIKKVGKRSIHQSQSANARLERFKKKLRAEQQQQPALWTAPAYSVAVKGSSPCTTDDFVRSPDLNEERLKKNLRAEQQQQPALWTAPAYSFAVKGSSPCTTDDFVRSPDLKDSANSELMDWEPIEEENPIAEKNLIEPSTATLVAKEEVPTCEYYDTVNENLLRLEAEKIDCRQLSGTKKWLRKHYYFVIDTNVVLRHLTFLDELSEMKLCGTTGSIVYLPYSVLQELDKLKMRESREGTKLLAVRAIKYLNSNMEANKWHIRAQSALDESKHEIRVGSADDSIINCCLQIKRHVNHIILLTEDANLRTKAMCNGILATTKSDLISKHAHNDKLNIE